MELFIMELWQESLLQNTVLNYTNQSPEIQIKIKMALSTFGSQKLYDEQVIFRDSALENMKKSQELLNGATQLFPKTIDYSNLTVEFEKLCKYGIVITAGGEGERLKESLLDEGYSEEELQDFTKATFPIPNFHEDFGALQVNLALISKISIQINHNIPVIVTTGPKGTTTARVIPQILKRHNNFGLKFLKVIEQNERLHLTTDNKIAWQEESGNIRIITNPDETGGPLMKLKEESLLWLQECSVSKIMVLQGTAIYNPNILGVIATAGVDFDGMGIGIKRETFPSDDPYGTFVLIEKAGEKELKIIEKDIRNSTTETLVSENAFLPFNTGFYVFDLALIAKNDLPPYATPEKIVLPTLPKAPKTGFAATDVISFAQNSGVLTISPNDFAVIKSSADLELLSQAAKEFQLQKLFE